MADEPRDLSQLERMDLFAGCADTDLDRIGAMLRPVVVQDGETLLRQGEPPSWFGLLTDGEAVIERTDGSGVHALAVAGPGSIVGELALLRGAVRTATVTARGEVRALVGDQVAFEQLLGVPGVHDRIIKLAGQKLASHAPPVVVTVKGGARFAIRPLLPTDRDEYSTRIDHLSEESRRRRFFTGGPVSRRIIDYLVDLDYVDHFAWVAFERRGGRGAGVARFIRDREERRTAEMAVGIVDEHHGLGLGSTLVGALAAAAQAAGIQRFTATALVDNHAVKAMLARVGATWHHAEPGVVGTDVAVDDVVRLIDADLAAVLRSTAAATMSAAHAPLA